MATKKNQTADIGDILEVSTGTLECCIVGNSPLVMNRMSEKAKHELLMPKGRKTATEKATSLKHDPLAEFRASPYTLSDEAETFLALPAAAFKGALCGAAIDMPGANKAQLGRLTYVPGELVQVFGIPKLYMAIVRSADMNKTPDVRTRAIVPRWACRLTVTFVKPLIQAQAVANLLAAGGITQGVGDGRQQKGKLSFGQFRLADAKDKEFLSIIREGGRAAQLEAMESPTCYDDETTELLSWFQTELDSRRKQGKLAEAKIEDKKSSAALRKGR